MRSIHTAVDCRPTTRICAPSVPPAASASRLTWACQSGFTYPVAPAYGLSALVPTGGVVVEVVVDELVVLVDVLVVEDDGDDVVDEPVVVVVGWPLVPQAWPLSVNAVGLE